MRFANSVLDLIGDTPLVCLGGTNADASAPLILAKLEYLNPGGSVKDRIVQRMVDAAERGGLLRPGGTIVEPTSGNTGIGLALVAQQRGYDCVFICPDKVSADKIAVLESYGARVVVCPTAVPPEHPDSYYQVSDRLARELPGGWKPNQYANLQGPLSHYHSTGPEIWRDTEGRVTHFIAGIGTGGTISGTGKYLKEVSNGRVRVIGADPVGSVYSGGSGRPYLVEGVGEDFWPEAYDATIPDDIIAVGDKDSFATTRQLAREEGLLVGGSSGMAVAAARQVAATAGSDDVIVVLLPDGGRGYVSKIFNDEWMSRYGFLSGSGDTEVGEVLSGKTGQLPALVHIHPKETVREAIDVLRRFGVSQLPVLIAEPPVVSAEVVGSVSEKLLLDALFKDAAALSDPIERHMAPAFPMLGEGVAVTDAVKQLASADAAMVLREGEP
ncbi:MAG TPA: cystathionine beta-synthase, partial [Mycobacteriales bacterium]|nr:cystathionine beta-synthase [Mycobacteriales bacterium]